MLEFCKGRYRARLARTDDDLRAAQRLRFRCFRAGQGEGLDADRHDALCRHLLVEPVEGGPPVATCRYRIFTDSLAESYAADFYDLSGLSALSGPKLEIGRFCIAPGCEDADVLRLAWAALTRVVDAEGVAVLFGCSSFAGTDASPYAEGLALLAARHLGPQPFLPGKKANENIVLAGIVGDMRKGLVQLPPLLRTYLAMGGWVGDHAVIDRDLGTLHVFTAVEIAKVPPARARLLRMDAA